MGGLFEIQRQCLKNDFEAIFALHTSYTLFHV
jgi:hypothetical protein